MAQAAISGGNPVEDIHVRTTVTGPQSQVAVIGIDGSDSVVQAHATRGLRVDTAGSSVTTARQTIATAGTPAQLSAGACKSILVVALPTNTQRVAIGDSNVNADSANLRGIPLEPLQGVGLDIDNANLLYLDVLGDGHGITYTLISG